MQEIHSTQWFDALQGWIQQPSVMAAALAILMPVIFVFVRHEVRLQRLRILDQFDRTFAPEGDAASADGHPHVQTPSFEYVREKYIEDLAHLQRFQGGAHRTGVDAEELRLVHSIGWWRLRSTWVLLFSAIPYVLACDAGFYLLLNCGRASCPPALLHGICGPLGVIGGFVDLTPQQADAVAHNVLTVAAFAFLGAYLFTLGILARAVSTFDLSPMTMVRITVQVITGVVGAVVAYRAFPDIVTSVANITKGGAVGVEFRTLSRLWLVVAFVFGLVPDMIINWLVSGAQAILGSKIPSDPFGTPPSVPLDIVDGVDFFIRFRLQQADIFQVQNLAVANPIMMFVETPYGIYQCVDWVAQAQLCTLVGPERFLAMRKYGIRTIFDLERGMLSKHTTAQMRSFIGGLMLTSPTADARSAGALKFWPTRSPADLADGALVGSDAFGKYAANLFAEPAVDIHGAPVAGDPDRSLKHLARIGVDDLHVHRLRQIWMQILRRLEVGQDHLLDTEMPDAETPPA